MHHPIAHPISPSDFPFPIEKMRPARSAVCLWPERRLQLINYGQLRAEPVAFSTASVSSAARESRKDPRLKLNPLLRLLSISTI